MSTNSTSAPKAVLGVVVLISGNGSNLQALIDKQNAHYKILAVISNKADAYGLERAKQAHIPAHTISHKDFPDRESFDLAMAEIIDQYQPGLVVLAGFMRILTEAFVLRYEGRMLNIHPSLLPKYKGLNTHQRAIESKDQIHGVSIHFVSHELDGGPVIIQASVPVHEGDDAKQLAQRVQEKEHLIYPLAIEWFASGRLRLENNAAILDGQRLEQPMQLEKLSL